MKKNPVPILSNRNLEKIEEIILKNNIETIIEFGSGDSTLYFLDKYKSQKVKFISVENSKFYFYNNIKFIESNFQCKDVVLKRKFWKFRSYKNFFDSKFSPYTPIQIGVSRTERWKRQMELGPFFRFEHDSTSRMAGKFKYLRSIFKLINYFLRIFPKYKNEKSRWECEIQNCKFIYHLISPGMKDQFGESPNREEYLNAPMVSVDQDDKDIMVMIDGGPRHFIVDRIIDILSYKNVHICLFDAHRPEYSEILNKYNGKFYKASDKLKNGYKYYEKYFPDIKTRDFIKNHELWYYFSKSQ